MMTWSHYTFLEMYNHDGVSYWNDGLSSYEDQRIFNKYQWILTVINIFSKYFSLNGQQKYRNMGEGWNEI